MEQIAKRAHNPQKDSVQRKDQEENGETTKKEAEHVCNNIAKPQEERGINQRSQVTVPASEKRNDEKQKEEMQTKQKDNSCAASTEHRKEQVDNTILQELKRLRGEIKGLKELIERMKQERFQTTEDESLMWCDHCKSIGHKERRLY